MAQIQILGSGSSLGTPVLGCECGVCKSGDPKNTRLRSAILISTDYEGQSRNILVDCGFDIKRQLMRAGVNKLDAVILTHPHADHISGLDELRVFTKLNEKNLLPK
jgi:phosphoribosyl 1,2-cyclic phosphate phosphodiesterase